MNPELNSSLIEKRKSQLNLILNWSKQTQNGSSSIGGETLSGAPPQVPEKGDADSSLLLTSVLRENGGPLNINNATTVIDIMENMDKVETSSLSPSSLDHIDITSSLFDSLNECCSKSLKLVKKVML
jgi:hypothetical protein